MVLPFDISPLKPDNVVSCRIVRERGYEVAYITYQDEDRKLPPTDWNVRLVLKKSEESRTAAVSSDTPFLNSSTPSHEPFSFTPLEAPDGLAEREQGEQKIALKSYPRDDVKDKLINLNGRACLVLGTTEAVFPEKQNDLFTAVLLSFYYTYKKSASETFEILKYCYYNTKNGDMFVDTYLERLNKAIRRETIEHYFSLRPKWSFSKIAEIYRNGVV